MANDLSPVGKIIVNVGKLFVAVALIAGVYFGYKVAFPKKVKITNITTKATGIPPLAYDKASNASFRKLADFNSPADVQTSEIRGGLMGWNAAAPINYAVGGAQTATGSLCDSLQLNIKLTVQNSCTEQGNQLYAFAQELHDLEANGGEKANPTKGYTFINWMADANASYFAGLDSALKHSFGDEYRAEVLYFSGTSFGEDKWMLKKKFQADPRGSLTACVVRDGDWNLLVAKCQLNGWPVNNDLGTWDASKVNVVDAPNGDYVESGKMYIEGRKITLHIVSNGKFTGRDTVMVVNGVSSWFPVDQQLVEKKGGLITMASTKEFNAQMGCGLIFIKKWADEHQDLVDKMIEAFARAGDQIKSHDEALQFASKVSEVVFADKEKTASDWYKAFKSFPLSDEDGNEVIIGGTRVFNIADNANYVGLTGGADKYKLIYNTFGNIDHESYPEIVSSFPAYDQAVDWSFMKRVYAKMNAAGAAGNASKTDFATATKGGVIGDANYAIQFNTGSAVISPASYPILDKVLAQLNIADNTFVEIAGHTDNTGDPDKNILLSQQRAASVQQYLVSKDANLGTANKITVQGFGQNKPLDANDQNSTGARAKNRRVEIKVFKAK